MPQWDSKLLSSMEMTAGVRQGEVVVSDHIAVFEGEGADDVALAVVEVVWCWAETLEVVDLGRSTE